MIREVILTGSIMASPVEGPNELSGYWENDRHAISINVTNNVFSAGEIVWYTTGFMVGEDVWYNGELYYSAEIDAYCADLTVVENTLLPTVLKPTPPLGTICMDVIDNTLLIGYSVEMRDFGNCLSMSWRPYISQRCDGNMDMFKKY